MYLELIFPFVILSFSFMLTEENSFGQSILDLEHLEWSGQAFGWMCNKILPYNLRVGTDCETVIIGVWLSRKKPQKSVNTIPYDL